MTDTLILCYHAVATGWDATVAVSEKRFAHQVELLHRLGYRGVTFSEAASTDAPGRRVAITFDDAFHSVLDRAFPVLQRRGWPATVFVVTDYGDGDRPIGWPTLDRWLGTPHEAELRALDWTELARLRDAGWEVGSHTCSHPNLTELSHDAVHRELAVSRQLCEKRLGKCISLAYPYGEVNPKVVEIAREVGYAAAAGLPSRLHPVRPLEWPRVGVYNVDHLPRFVAKTLPGARWLRTSGSQERVGRL